MIRFGIVGTSWISAEFIKACADIEKIKVVAVYSREKITGEKFADENGISMIFNDYERMLESGEIDAVYIASPNAIHFTQAVAALNKGKHVMCEKAITSNMRELEALLEVARRNKVLIIEAVKILSMPIFKIIKEKMNEIGEIRQVLFNFCQQSSKYDAYKRGELPNIFNPKFSAGGLMDIGIYCVYPCIALFGMPKGIKSQVTMLESGVDGSGSLIFEYDTFQVSLMYSKINDSVAPSEIMGEEGSLIIHRISAPNKVLQVEGRGSKEARELRPNEEHIPMYYEIKEFVDVLERGEVESKLYSHEIMKQVMTVLDSIRKENGIVFPADN